MKRPSSLCVVSKRWVWGKPKSKPTPVSVPGESVLPPLLLLQQLPRCWRIVKSAVFPFLLTPTTVSGERVGTQGALGADRSYWQHIEDGGRGHHVHNSTVPLLRLSIAVIPHPLAGARTLSNHVGEHEAGFAGPAFTTNNSN